MNSMVCEEGNNVWFYRLESIFILDKKVIVQLNPLENVQTTYNWRLLKLLIPRFYHCCIRKIIIIKYVQLAWNLVVMEIVKRTFLVMCSFRMIIVNSVHSFYIFFVRWKCFVYCGWFLRSDVTHFFAVSVLLFVLPSVVFVNLWECYYLTIVRWV